MPTIATFGVEPSLQLVRYTLDRAQQQILTPSPTNHIAVIDCSGSMSSDLPKLRTQLKNKLAKLLGPNDTISIIWFSGRGEFGVLVEAEKVAGLKDLAAIHAAIDRWLKPVGMTGFKEPLEEVSRLIARVSNGYVWSLFFMSDGCDNQWPRAQILETIRAAAGSLQAATFVEYGYYADRALLAAMADTAGGAHIFAADFAAFEPVMDGALQRQALATPKVQISIDHAVVGDVVFAIDESRRELRTYEVKPAGLIDSCTIDADVRRVWYLSKGATSFPRAVLSQTAPQATYAALSLFAMRAMPDVVYALLRNLGDVSLIREFGGCFGKQRYSAFMARAHAAAFDPSLRGAGGYDRNAVPPDDAFTVFDLLQVLEESNARVQLDHPEFKYSLIGRQQADADTMMTATEKKRADEIAQEMSKTRAAKKLKELNAELDALLGAKRDALVFEAADAPDGYAIAGLTYNEERPNISILVRKPGTVDLRRRVQDTNAAGLCNFPLDFSTHIWRNYTLVRDGLVNVSRLPLRMNLETFKQLQKLGLTSDHLAAADPANHSTATVLQRTLALVDIVIKLDELPVLNRKTVRETSTSAAALALNEWQLIHARAAQKVYKNLLEALAPLEKSQTFVARYGQAAADWLAAQGLTDGGFNPKRVTMPSTDCYLGKELSITIKGYAGKLPSLNEVRKKMAPDKMPTGLAGLMAARLREAEAFIKANPKKFHASWLEGQQKIWIATTRGLLQNKARAVFSLIVGQTWFPEFKSFEENVLTFNDPSGTPRTATFKMNDVEIEI